MLLEVKNFLEKYNIKNKKVIVGFSAGPDSCAMAFLLSKLANEFNLKLILAYFNHNWRVEEAKSEEEFTKDFALKIGSEYVIEKAPLDCSKTEETARDLRYSFFENIAKKYQSDTVILAHNKNDNIETLIYRVAKGTGTAGLCSIPQHRDIYYRPLLNISKAQILNYLIENNIEFKIDSSNENIKYKRNLIRKEILPLFEKINPIYLDSIENLIKNAISTREIVDDVLKNLELELLENGQIIQDKYLSKSMALRYEFLNRFIGDKLKYRNYKNIKKFDDFILENKNSQISVNKELYLRIKKNKIYLVEHNDYSKCEE